jgi:hypothetical protein
MLSHLLLNPCLLFPIKKPKWVVLKAWGDACYIARKELQLVFAWQAEPKHPSLRLCKFRLGDRLVAAAALHVREIWKGLDGDTLNLRKIGAGRVRGASEDIGGAII